MVVIENRRQVFAERIIGGKFYAPDILSACQFIVVVVQVTNDRLVVSVRQVGLNVNVATNDALRVVGQSRRENHVLKAIPQSEDVFDSLYFGQEIVVETHRQGTIFFHFGQNLERILHFHIDSYKRVELLDQVLQVRHIAVVHGARNTSIRQATIRNTHT